MAAPTIDREMLIGELMFSFMRFRKGMMRSAVSAQKLPPAQMEALFTIGAHGDMVPGALAQHLCVTPGAVTQVVDSLIEAGHVERRQDPDDRRGSHLALTPAGIDCLDVVKGAKLEHLSKLLEPLSDEELATLAELLARISPPISISQE